MAMALKGTLDIENLGDDAHKGPAMADALGDQSDMEEEADREDEDLRETRRGEEGFFDHVR